MSGGAEGGAGKAELEQQLAVLGLRIDGDGAAMRQRLSKPTLSDAGESLRGSDWRKVHLRAEEAPVYAAFKRGGHALRLFDGLAAVRDGGSVPRDGAALRFVAPTDVTLPCGGRVKCVVC